MSIINKIVQLCKEKGITQQVLCNRLGITSGTFSTWKSRDTDPPAKYISRICELLGVSADYLLTGKEKSSSPELTEEEHKCLEVFNRLEPEDKIRFIAKMEQRYEDYSSEFSEELTPDVEKNVS